MNDVDIQTFLQDLYATGQQHEAVLQEVRTIERDLRAQFLSFIFFATQPGKLHAKML
jgi:hypothetical protein